MRKVTTRSAPYETAEILREEILGYDGEADEWLLGSEDAVIRMLGISRPTLRQAARMLEQEQLLIVRRGIGGGLYGRRPTGQAVSHTASVYLRSQGATYKDLISTQLLLGVECARLAAMNGDVVARQGLRDFYRLRVPGADFLPTPEFIRHTVDFQRRIAELANNPALELFVNVLMDLSSGSAPIARIYAEPDRQRQTFDRHQAIGSAIADGDSTGAAERMQRHVASLLGWVDSATVAEPLRPLPHR